MVLTSQLYAWLVGWLVSRMVGVSVIVGLKGRELTFPWLSEHYVDVTWFFPFLGYWAVQRYQVHPSNAWKERQSTKMKRIHLKLIKIEYILSFFSKSFYYFQWNATFSLLTKIKWEMQFKVETWRQIQTWETVFRW